MTVSVSVLDDNGTCAPIASIRERFHGVGEVVPYGEGCVPLCVDAFCSSAGIDLARAKSWQRGAVFETLRALCLCLICKEVCGLCNYSLLRRLA